MATFDEGGLGLGLEWARCPKCKEEGTWENDVFECCVCLGTFRRTPLAPDTATPSEADAPLPCAICGKPNEIGDICEDCARIHAPVDDDDSNIPLASGHGYGY